FTAALPGLFEATRRVRWMNLAGDLSYPVYLVHSAVLVLLIGGWLQSGASSYDGLVDRQDAYLSVAIYLAVTVVAAAAVHRLIELPTASLMRKALRGWKWRSAPAE